MIKNNLKEMHLGIFNKKKLINFLLYTYKNTLYEVLYTHKDKLIPLIYELDDTDFYNIIIHLNRKSYIGYYSLHISNNLKQAIIKDDYDEVEHIIRYPNFDEVLKNSKLDPVFIEYVKKMIQYEKIAYNMLLEKCTLNADVEISNIELHNCKREMNIDLDCKHFDRHKTTVALIKRGQDIIYDVNDLIYRCFKNMNDYDDEKFSYGTYDFVKTNYKNEILIIENYLLNKN